VSDVNQNLDMRLHVLSRTSPEVRATTGALYFRASRSHAGYDSALTPVSLALAYGDLARPRPGVTASQVPGLSPATVWWGLPRRSSMRRLFGRSVARLRPQMRGFAAAVSARQENEHRAETGVPPTRKGRADHTAPLNGRTWRLRRRASPSREPCGRPGLCIPAAIRATLWPDQNVSGLRAALGNGGHAIPDGPRLQALAADEPKDCAIRIASGNELTVCEGPWTDTARPCW
jgi:hypothetical protein